MGNRSVFYQALGEEPKEEKKEQATGTRAAFYSALADNDEQTPATASASGYNSLALPTPDEWANRYMGELGANLRLNTTQQKTQPAQTQPTQAKPTQTAGASMALPTPEEWANRAQGELSAALRTVPGGSVTVQPTQRTTTTKPDYSALEDKLRAAAPKQEEEKAEGFTHKSGKIDEPSEKTPTLLERIGNTAKAAGLGRVAGNFNAAGVAMESRGGTAATELYEEELESIKKRREALATQMRDDPAYAKDSEAVWQLSQYDDRIQTLEEAIRANKGTAKEIYKAADELQEESSKASEEAQRGASKVGKLALKAGQSAADMVIDRLESAIVPSLGLAAMGLRSFGSSAQEARREGANLGQQKLYGLGNAATEVGSELMFDFVKIAGFGGMDDLVESVISKVAKTPAAYNLLKVGASALGESVEEAVAGAIEPGLKAIYDDEKFGSKKHYNKETILETLESMLIGGLLGGAGGAVQVGVDTVANRDESGLHLPTPEEWANRNSRAATETSEEAKPTVGTTETTEAAESKKTAPEGTEEAGKGVRGLLQRVSDYVDRAIARSKFVENPVISDEQFEDLPMGMISEKTVEQIKREYGRDLSGYEHILRDNDVRHMYNSHGPHTPEALPITAEDIKKVPTIINNPTDVYLLERDDGKTGIMYRYDAEHSTYYLEAVVDAEKKLVNKQMIKVPLGEVPDVPKLPEAIQKKSTSPIPGDAAEAVPQMYVQDVKADAKNNVTPASPEVKSDLSQPTPEGFTYEEWEKQQQPAQPGQTMPGPEGFSYSEWESGQKAKTAQEEARSTATPENQRLPSPEDVAEVESWRQQEAQQAEEDRMADEEAYRAAKAEEDEEAAYAKAEREGKQMERTVPPKAPKSRATLKQRVQEIFSIQEGSKGRVNEIVDAIADDIQNGRSISEERMERLFDAIYEKGSYTREADAYFRNFRDTVKGTKIYVSPEVRAEFGEDWKALANRARRAGITFTDNINDKGPDIHAAELAEIYGMLDTQAHPAQQLEQIVDTAERGKAEVLTQEEMEDILRGEYGDEMVQARMDDMAQKFRQVLDVFRQSAETETGVRAAADAKIKKAQETASALAKKQMERKALADLQNRTLKQLQWLSKNRNRTDSEMRARFDSVLRNIDTIAVNAANAMHTDNATGKTWRDLADLYKKAKESDPNFLPSKRLDDIVMRLDGEKIGDMDYNALQDLYKAAVGLRTEYYNRNNVINDELGRTFADAYHDSVDEFKATKGYGEGKGESKASRWFNRLQLTPANYLRSLVGWKKGSTFASFGKQLENGERAYKKYVVDSAKQLEKFIKENKDWVRRADGQGKDAIWYEYEVPELVELHMGDKPLAYLFPYGYESCAALFLIGLLRSEPDVVIVVHIQDNVEVLIVGVVNYLLNAVHPLIFYVIAVHMLAPRNRYTHCIEAGFLYLCEHFLGSTGISPCCLGVCGPRLVIVAFKSISQVPADFYIIGYILCGPETVFLCAYRHSNRLGNVS